MKIIKNSKKFGTAVAFAAAFFVGAVPMTVSAHTGPEAECICDTRCTKDNVNESCPVCSEDISICQGKEAKEEKKEAVTDEPTTDEAVTSELATEEAVTEEPDNDGKPGPLTPDGNMSVVDDYGTLKAGGKQFITVVTKSGNYFYIIIDRDDQGQETVHFLNMVDESDLLKLMSDDEKKAYEEKTGASDKAATASSVSEPETETQKPEVKKPEKKTGVSPATLVALLAFLGAGGYMGYKYVKGKGSKKGNVNPDPDEDYSEDDEDYISTLNAQSVGSDVPDEAAEPEYDPEDDDDADGDEQDAEDDESK